MNKDELLARELEKLSLKPTAPMFFGHAEPKAILDVKMLLNKLTKWNFYSILQKYDFEQLKEFIVQNHDNCSAFLSVLFRSIRKSPLGVELTTYFLIQIFNQPLPAEFLGELISLATSKLSSELLSPILQKDQEQRIKLLQYKLSLVRMAALLESHSLFVPEKTLSLLKQMVESKIQDEMHFEERFDLILWMILNLLEHSLFPQRVGEFYLFFVEQAGSIKLSQRQKILIKVRRFYSQLPQEVGEIVSQRNKQAKGIMLSLFSMFYELPRPLIQECFVWIKEDTI